MLCLSDFELYSRWVPLTKVDWRNIKLLIIIHLGRDLEIQ